MSVGECCDGSGGAWFFWGKAPIWYGTCNVHFAEIGFGFASGEAADGDAGRVALGHFATAVPAHVEVEAALDDAEQVLSVRVLVGGDAPVEPSDAAFHGLLHARVIGRGGLDDIVELHDDVRADGVLQIDRVLRGE